MKEIKLYNEVLVINSRIIAEELGKRHDHLLSKIEEVLQIGVSHKNGEGVEAIKSQYIHEQNKQTYTEYLLTKDGLTLLMMNYTGYNDFKREYIKRFNAMEKALQDIKFRVGDKKHQLECMEILSSLLSDEEKKDKVSYIKANMIVNKITSDYFGLVLAIKKIDMNAEMMQVREKVLNDYLKLYEVFENNSEVKEALSKKYKRLVIDYAKNIEEDEEKEND